MSWYRRLDRTLGGYLPGGNSPAEVRARQEMERNPPTHLGQYSYDPSAQGAPGGGLPSGGAGGYGGLPQNGAFQTGAPQSYGFPDPSDGWGGGGQGGGGGGGGGGWLGGAWDWTKDNAHWILPVGAGIYGAFQGRKANELNERGLEHSIEQWNERAPLREAALGGLVADIPDRPDLSGMFADPGNPYHQGYRPPQQTPPWMPALGGLRKPPK